MSFFIYLNFQFPEPIMQRESLEFFKVWQNAYSLLRSRVRFPLYFFIFSTFSTYFFICIFFIFSTCFFIFSTCFFIFPSNFLSQQPIYKRRTRNSSKFLGHFPESDVIKGEASCDRKILDLGQGPGFALDMKCTSELRSIARERFYKYPHGLGGIGTKKII